MGIPSHLVSLFSGSIGAPVLFEVTGEWSKSSWRLLGTGNTFSKSLAQDFFGVPVAETLHSQGRGPRFHPWSGN